MRLFNGLKLKLTGDNNFRMGNLVYRLAHHPPWEVSRLLFCNKLTTFGCGFWSRGLLVGYDGCSKDMKNVWLKWLSIKHNASGCLFISFVCCWFGYSASLCSSLGVKVWICDPFRTCPCLFSMDNNNIRSWNILNWNVRGLNSADKCNAIRAKIE
jgi:hypothetical protein